MSIPALRPRLAALLGALVLSACSSSDDPSTVLLGASQDLTLDPTGATTILSFSAPLPAMMTPGNFEADGGQLATGVAVVGSEATVTWDERVSPSDQVRAVHGGIAASFVGVTTTDATPPTFAVTGGQQNPGLGGDVVTVLFSGARVLENCAEDPANWVLRVNGTSLDLTGSAFDLDFDTQVLTATLGPLANLHASFDLAPTAAVVSVADVSLATTPVVGAASGDATAPTLVSAEQNLTPDEFGFVVDFTFSEAMDPVFSVGLSSFDAGFPVFATQVEQPSDEVLRVTFNAPIIPGADDIDLSGLLDVHGNAFPDAPGTAIMAGSTVANAFQAGGPVVTTVANAGGDTIVASLLQAVDPDTAEEPVRWQLESPIGTPVDISGAAFSYDLFAKTLTVTLVQDLVTADDFRFGGAAGAPFPLDVDGEDFTTTFDGVVVGDMVVPSATAILQNRQIDDTGLTLDVLLTEDVDQVAAEATTNYVPSNGAGVTGATLLGSMDIVRLTLDTLTVPGDATFDVQNLVDLAGNAMAVQAAIAIGSTDTAAPTAGGAAVLTPVGVENDTVTVVFDDRMITAEVTDPTSWDLESPVGTPVDTSMAAVSYSTSTGQAVLVFDGGDGINLKRGDSFQVVLGTMRDVSGNAVDATPLVGIVTGEDEPPQLESVWVETLDPNKVHLRFDEPSLFFDDPLTTYVIRDGMGMDIGGGVPTVVVDADFRGAVLSFGTAADPLLHTIDVRGVTDATGNQMFPAEAFPIDSEEGAGPGLEIGSQVHLAVSGEDNDVLTVVFDRPVSTWGLFDPAGWALTDGMAVADFGLAEFDFDGDRTVTASFSLPGGYTFDLTGDTLTVDGLSSAQGLPMAAPSVDVTMVDGGSDMAAPQFGLTGVRLDPAAPANSVLIEMDEALEPVGADTEANYSHDTLAIPDSVDVLGPRTVRATWTVGGLVPGAMVDVTVPDAAGNVGLVSQAIQAADTTGPVLTFAEGIAGEGLGGDSLVIRFNEPVTAVSALQPGSYTVTAGGAPLDLSGSTFRYESSTNTVTVLLPETVDLDVMDALHFSVTGVQNHSGLVIDPPGDRNATVGGDALAPAFDAGFVNLRADPGGTMVDLRFTEDVDPTTAALPVNYSSTGGQTVLAAELVAGHIVRLTLSAPLGAGDVIDANGLSDVAGNDAGTICVTPTL